MRTSTRRSFEPELSDVVAEALREGHEVTLEDVDGELGLAIDGETLVVGLPWETFSYPLSPCGLSDHARDVAEEFVRRRDRRRYHRRMDRLETDSHLAAHGGELPAGGEP